MKFHNLTLQMQNIYNHSFPVKLNLDITVIKAFPKKSLFVKLLLYDLLSYIKPQNSCVNY